MRKLVFPIPNVDIFYNSKTSVACKAARTISAMSSFSSASFNAVNLALVAGCDGAAVQPFAFWIEISKVPIFLATTSVSVLSKPNSGR